MPLRGALIAVIMLGAIPAACPGGAGAAPGPINGKLAFTKENGSGQSWGGIFTIKPNGTDLKRLTWRGATPIWSPDGHMIIYRIREGNKAGLWVMRGDGTKRRRVRAGASPAWSPDGRQIVFTHDEYGGGIYVMRLDGTHVRRVVGRGYFPYFPQWSPNGKQIAFSGSDPAAASAQVFVVGVNGGTPRQLTRTNTDDTINYLEPKWSPNSKLVVFWGRDATTHTSQVFVVSVNGGRPRRLTTPVHGDRDNSFDPEWSPDGRRIAYVNTPGRVTCRKRTRPDSLFVMNADGTAWSQLHLVPG
jgi:TolB protein